LLPKLRKHGGIIFSTRQAACFIEKGFHSTSMADIGKEAAVSPGALYTYFCFQGRVRRRAFPGERWNG
jgi:Bacterial regulatory proteins, tetR family